MNTIRTHILFFCLITGLISTACNSEKKAEKLNIFAAASLQDVLNKTSELYQEKTGVELSLNFASSGLLARQIEQGAEFDFFFSANENWVNYLLEKNLLQVESKLNLAKNKMAIIVPKESKIDAFENATPEQMLSLFSGRLAIGNPDHVPAGKYAKEILTYYKLWETFKSRLLPCKNARETLLMVEMGEVDMGIIYLSDAKKSNKVRCLYEFSEDCSSPILYYSAHRTNPDSRILKFQNFLKQAESRKIWKDYAFIIND